MKFSVAEHRILHDNTSGSSDIIIAALDCLLARMARGKDAHESQKQARKFLRALARRFSAMAMVVGATERADACLGSHRDTAESISALEGFREDIRRMDDDAVQNCRGLFIKKITVVTYSNSGLVRKVIGRYAKKVRRLYLSEARPACEGRVAAKHYADLGIPVTYCADALLPSFLREADLILVGADRIGRDCFVNKIGTAALLRPARDAGCTRAVVFESLKIRPDENMAESIRDYPRTELWKGRGRANLTVRNPYFETIPLELADRYISDRGIDTPRSLMKKIKTGR